MMKRFLTVFLVLFAMMTMPAFAQDIRVVVDDTEVVFDVAPAMVDGRTLVPLRAIAESLDAEVFWEEAAQQITLTKDGITNALVIDSITAMQSTPDGTVRTITLDVPPMIIDGRTMVPARYVAESFGAQVKWLPEIGVIAISTTGEPVEIPESLSETEAENPTEPVQPEEPPATAAVQSSAITGSGDSVIQIAYPDAIGVLFIEGNEADVYFGVKGYDENGKYTSLFVNTTEPYKGIVLDFKAESKTLEVSAKGDWSIEPSSSKSCRLITPGQTLTGSGDEVLVISGGATLQIKGNESARYFGVKAYSENGRYNLLVNTTDAYEGTVMLKDNPIIIEVLASDTWSITVN